MAWSLLNLGLASQVDALLDASVASYKDDASFAPVITREKAAAIIHSVLWAAGSKNGSTSGVLALDNLYAAIGDDMIKWLWERKQFEDRLGPGTAIRKLGEE